MDDDMVIRLAMAKLIEGLGYIVDTYENGEDAVVAYQKEFSSGSPYDILILDYTVKNGINGKETMSQIKDINPSAIGILASGRVQDSEFDNYQDFGFAKIIAKPFTIQDLAKILKELLPA